MYYTVQILETLSVFWVSLFIFFCNAVAGRRDSHQTRVLTHFLLPPFVPFYWWFGVLAVGGGGGGRWGGVAQIGGLVQKRRCSGGRDELVCLVETNGGAAVISLIDGP